MDNLLGRQKNFVNAKTYDAKTGIAKGKIRQVKISLLKFLTSTIKIDRTKRLKSLKIQT